MSLVRFSMRNHPQQVKGRTRQPDLFGGREDQTDEVDDRATDPRTFNELDARFSFTLDVAASEANAKCERFYTLTEDGLAQPWAGERVWCNPPYSNIRPWVQKAHREDALIVMLLPANRTEQAWWQDLVEPFRDGPIDRSLTVEFLRGRREFILPGDGGRKHVPFGNCILVWARGVTP